MTALTTALRQSVPAWFAALLILAAVLWSFHAQQPSAEAYTQGSPVAFSQQKALAHLEVIARAPHYLGSEDHRRVQDYLFEQLTVLGLEVERFTQLGTHFRRQFSAAETTSLVARIPGRLPGNALALMSHYDSSLHSSLGASDAGSGVVTILETVRAFLASGHTPRNDILILITDGEERGLLGAEAFVTNHPWAREVKLVLNLEARGSGGPSYMLLETNGGNAALVQAFADAGLAHPAANSLMYSIYKMLPNDTDLTVFRENAAIPGFNFAFIDDHFDYHTVQDSVARLDRASLNHQAEYLTTLLAHFAEADLNALTAEEERVYFNFPGVGMVHYPFDWGLGLALLAGALLLIHLVLDIRRGNLTGRHLVRGAVATVMSLTVAIIIGFGGWQLLLRIFPQYGEISHGFTYNGHWILSAGLALSAAATLVLFRWAGSKQSLQLLYPLPLLLWLVLNIALAVTLPGAAFLVWPLLIALLALFLVPPKPSLAWQIPVLLLALLPIMMLVPLIPAFIVGLGLKAMAVGTVLLTLLLALLLPLCQSERLIALGIRVSLLLAVITFTVSVTQSDYSADRKKPNSINYLVDHDSQQAYWLSSNRRLDDFISQFLDTPQDGALWPQSLYPNYRSARVRWFQSAELQPMAPAEITLLSDTQDSTGRTLILRVQPFRPTALLQLATEVPLTVSRMLVNGQPFQQGEQWAGANFDAGFIFTYTQADPLAPLLLEFTVPTNAPLKLKLFETSYDLYQQFDQITPRGRAEMPEPFIVNDAIIIGQSLLRREATAPADASEQSEPSP